MMFPQGVQSRLIKFEGKIEIVDDIARSQSYFSRSNNDIDLPPLRYIRCVRSSMSQTQDRWINEGKNESIPKMPRRKCDIDKFDEQQFRSSLDLSIATAV